MNLIWGGVASLLLAFLWILYFTIQEKTFHTFFLIRHCKVLYLYAFLHGIASMIVFLLIESGYMTFTQLQLGMNVKSAADHSILGAGTWIIIVLISLNIRNILTNDSIKLGNYSLNSLYRETIGRVKDLVDAYEYNHLCAFLKPYEEKYPLEESKSRIISELKQRFSESEVRALMNEFKESTGARRVFEIYLKKFGRENFQRIFPL